jgi:hypothetical protein
MDEKVTYNKSTFTSLVAQYLFMDSNSVEDMAILNEFWNAYDSEYKNLPVAIDDIPDLLVSTNKAPTFNAKYKTYIDLRKNPNNATGITSLAEFNQARKEYKNLLSFYNLKDMANDQTVDQFLSNNVSLAEAGARMQAAYDAIKTADTFLKEQLGQYNLSDQDVAKALLLGKEGAIELQDKINTANILAAQSQVGLTSQLGAQELARQGVTRSQAAQGLAATKGQLAGYQAEATRQGQDATTIQSELEKENVLGLASQRRKKLQQSGASTFSGKSGTMQTSLNKSALGSI